MLKITKERETAVKKLTTMVNRLGTVKVRKTSIINFMKRYELYEYIPMKDGGPKAQRNENVDRFDLYVPFIVFGLSEEITLFISRRLKTFSMTCDKNGNWNLK